MNVFRQKGLLKKKTQKQNKEIFLKDFQTIKFGFF